jgi:hypothetical protein
MAPTLQRLPPGDRNTGEGQVTTALTAESSTTTSPMKSPPVDGLIDARLTPVSEDGVSTRGLNGKARTDAPPKPSARTTSDPRWTAVGSSRAAAYGLCYHLAHAEDLQTLLHLRENEQLKDEVEAARRAVYRALAATPARPMDGAPSPTAGAHRRDRVSVDQAAHAASEWQVERSHGVDGQEFYQLRDQDGITNEIHLFASCSGNGRTTQLLPAARGLGRTDPVRTAGRGDEGGIAPAS